MVSMVSCIMLVWYMRTHIKNISKEHNERFDKLHEMHRSERDEKDKQHRAERDEKDRQHKEERAIMISALDKVALSSENVAKAVNGLEVTNARLTTFIEAKI